MLRVSTIAPLHGMYVNPGLKGVVLFELKYRRWLSCVTLKISDRPVYSNVYPNIS